MSKAWLAALWAAGLMAVTAAPASAETVKVGVIAPFSGPFARWGEQFQQAIKVYQKQHGESVSGNTIEVIYRDSGGPDPARAKQLAEELILRENVQFIGGFTFTPNALAVADLVTEAKMPTIIFNASTAANTRKSPYFVRTSQTIPQVTVEIAKWAAKNGIKRAITAVTDYAPGYDAETYFAKTFKAGGGEILEFDPHSARDHGFLTILRARTATEARRPVHLRTGRAAHSWYDQHLGIPAQAGGNQAPVHR